MSVRAVGEGAQAVARSAHVAVPEPAREPLLVPVGEIEGLVGCRLGVGVPRTITQAMVDEFGRLTGDEQWIHTDPVRAAGGPFGGTIAHGFLTLSLSTVAIGEVVRFTGVSAVVNHGVQDVRFVAPVRVGAAVRCAVAIDSTRRRGRAFREVVLATTFTDDAEVTVCTARIVVLLGVAG
jgi:acyl dehydratase